MERHLPLMQGPEIVLRTDAKVAHGKLMNKVYRFKFISPGERSWASYQPPVL